MPGSSPLVRGAHSVRRIFRASCRIIPARAGSTAPGRCLCGPHRDHPRSCGEHESPIVAVEPRVGSSPLVRGALKRDSPDVAVARIIPARAGSTGTSEDTTRQDGDHPRSCGEHSGSIAIAVVLAGIIPARAGSTSTSASTTMQARGSSPLVRGAPVFPASPRRNYRIIPARAGSTACEEGGLAMNGDHPRSCGEHPSCTGPAAVRSRDHPRSCGEHILWECTECGHEGSSPLVRGARCRSARSLCQRWDHPRSCGEHRLVLAGHRQGRGSSPLVRGAPSRCARCASWTRIIPARAGSTFRQGRAHLPARDHPRSCGEHARYWQTCRPEEGSSPLVRGALRREAGRSLPAGIIPARAGSTLSAKRHEKRPGDHPRSCGEHYGCAWRVLDAQGSSPLVRGAHDIRVHDMRQTGIIPARAGSTSSAKWWTASMWDHPRSCGEHARLALFALPRPGSSPLVRGAPRWQRFRAGAGRIIPARAGSTRRPSPCPS